MRLSRILVGTLPLLLSVTAVAVAQPAPAACIPTVITSPDVTISWVKLADSAGLTLTGYRIDRQRLPEAWTVLRTVPPTVLSTPDEGLQPGATYHYAVYSEYTTATGTPVTSAAGTPATDDPPCVRIAVLPAAPTDVRVKAR